MSQSWTIEMSSKQLRKFCFFHRNELRKLEKILDQRRLEKQSNCAHVWTKDISARSGRSHYDCTKCGVYK